MFQYDESRHGSIQQGDATCKGMEVLAIEVINNYIVKYRAEKGGNFEGLREYLKSPVVVYELTRIMTDRKKSEGFLKVWMNIRDSFLEKEGQL